MFSKDGKRNKEKEKLNKEFERLDNIYLDFIYEHNCESCGCYNAGNVKTFSMRFKDCQSCEYMNDIRETAKMMDDLVLKLESY